MSCHAFRHWPETTKEGDGNCSPNTMTGSQFPIKNQDHSKVETVRRPEITGEERDEGGGQDTLMLSSGVLLSGARRRELGGQGICRGKLGD
jgi:hypothetical protein